MINAVPSMATVADLQRSYRVLVEKMKKSGEPVVVVSNGQPDIVVMGPVVYNNQVKRMRELEEEYLLKAGEEGIREYKKGKR